MSKSPQVRTIFVNQEFKSETFTIDCGKDGKFKAHFEVSLSDIGSRLPGVSDPMYWVFQMDETDSGTVWNCTPCEGFRVFEDAVAWAKNNCN